MLPPSFNTQPPEGGWKQDLGSAFTAAQFQHTAARRRLELSCSVTRWICGFNTQPPEGGWLCQITGCQFCFQFQHTAARRRLVPD